MRNSNPAPDFGNLAAVIVVMSLLSLFYFQSAAAPQPSEMSYSAFTTAVDEGEIRSVTCNARMLK
jgi:cell division protease FtsH